MSRVTKIGLGVAVTGLLLAGVGARLLAQPPGEEKEKRKPEMPQKLLDEAERMGVKPEDLLREQRKFEIEMEKERIKQPPTLLVHGDSLFVVRGPWLYQFDLQTLELKNMQNLDFLTDRFFQKMKQEKLREREGGEQPEKREKNRGE